MQYPATKETGDERQADAHLQSMSKQASEHIDKGQLVEAEDLMEQVVVQKRRTLGPAHQATLSSTNDLVKVLDRRGRYDAAEALQLQTVGEREKGLQAAIADILDDLDNLATLFKHDEKYDDAEAVSRQILELREKWLGANHCDTASNEGNLAEILLSGGKGARG